MAPSAIPRQVYSIQVCILYIRFNLVMGKVMYRFGFSRFVVVRRHMEWFVSRLVWGSVCMKAFRRRLAFVPFFVIYLLG